MKIDGIVKSPLEQLSSFRRKSESRKIELVPDFRRNTVWTPAGVYPADGGAGVTMWETFYESIEIDGLVKSQDGFTSRPFSANTLPLIRRTPKSHFQKIIQVSRERYSRLLEKVEE